MSSCPHGMHESWRAAGVACPRCEVERLRALLAEVAELGDVCHGEDDECPAGQFDDEEHEPGCIIAHHNDVLARARAAVAPK